MATPSCLLRLQQWVSCRILNDATHGLAGLCLAGRVETQQGKVLKQSHMPAHLELCW